MAIPKFSIEYIKCEECNILVWAGCGPMLCPRCNKDVCMQEQVNSIKFLVQRCTNYFLKKDDVSPELFNVRHYIYLCDMTPEELLQLIEYPNSANNSHLFQ